MKTWLVACVVAASFLVGSLPGSAQNVQEILDKVEQAYANAKSFQMQATVEISRQQGQQTQRQTVTVSNRFKAPNKMVLIAKGDEDTQIYSDGKTLYIYSPKRKEYIKQAAPVSLDQGLGMPGAGSPKQLSTQLKMMFSANAKLLKESQVAGRPVLVLQAAQSGPMPGQQPGQQQGSFSQTVTASIDKANYTLRRLVMTVTASQGGQKFTQNITMNIQSQQINPSIPDSAFVFKPPAGAQEKTMPMPPGGAPTPR